MAKLDRSLIIGVDGGGTGCRVIIADVALTPHSQTSGGPANVSTDFEGSIRNIQEAISKAAIDAGISNADLHAATVHLGLAGVISPEIATHVARALPYQNSVVTDDRPTTLVGALGEQDGSLLSVGTGVIIASCRDKQLRFASGWGFQLSDHGSGAWLGSRVLEEVLFCYDGLRAHSFLTRELLAKFDNLPEDLAKFSLQASPGDFAKFAPEIIVASKLGDPTALALLQEGAQHLQAGLTATGFAVGDPLCLTGGVGAKYVEYLDEGFTENLVEPENDAVCGALMLAAQAYETRR